MTEMKMGMAADESPGYFDGKVKFWGECSAVYRCGVWCAGGPGGIVLHNHEDGFHYVYLVGEKIEDS